MEEPKTSRLRLFCSIARRAAADLGTERGNYRASEGATEYKVTRPKLRVLVRARSAAVLDGGLLSLLLTVFALHWISSYI